MGSIGLEELTPTVEEFTELPDGTYAANITGSEWRTSAAGHEYVSVEFTIGEQSAANMKTYAGRKIWTNLNFRHPNEVVVEIAKNTASELCRALGMRGLQEPEDLLGHNLQIKVGPNKKEPDRKEIKRYLASGPVVATAPPQPAATNGAAPGGNAFPWEAA